MRNTKGSAVAVSAVADPGQVSSTTREFPCRTSTAISSRLGDEDLRAAREATATPDAVRQLRRWVEDLCLAAGAGRPLRTDIALAVSEALTNVVLHAYADRPEPGAVRIRTELVDDRLLVEVEDDGIGMRPRVDSPGSGLGLQLIATLAAELELARGRTGDGVRLRMAFPL